MAADDISTEYHLTPAGWVTGTVRSFGSSGGKEEERPKNAVETWLHRIYQRSIWSQEEITSRIVWCDESTSETVREALHAKFNRPF